MELAAAAEATGAKIKAACAALESKLKEALAALAKAKGIAEPSSSTSSRAQLHEMSGKGATVDEAMAVWRRHGGGMAAAWRAAQRHRSARGACMGHGERTEQRGRVAGHTEGAAGE